MCLSERWSIPKVSLVSFLPAITQMFATFVPFLPAVGGTRCLRIAARDRHKRKCVPCTRQRNNQMGNLVKVLL